MHCLGDIIRYNFFFFIWYTQYLRKTWSSLRERGKVEERVNPDRRVESLLPKHSHSLRSASLVGGLFMALALLPRSPWHMEIVEETDGTRLERKTGSLGPREIRREKNAQDTVSPLWKWRAPRAYKVVNILKGIAICGVSAKKSLKPMLLSLRCGCMPTEPVYIKFSTLFSPKRHWVSQVHAIIAQT